MTIESSPKPAAAPKANSNADTRAAKSRGGPDAADASPGQGFNAILSSVSDVQGDAPVGAAVGVSSDTPSDTSTVQGAPGDDQKIAAVVDQASMLAQAQPVAPIPVPGVNGDVPSPVAGSANRLAGFRPDARAESDLSVAGGAESRTKGLQRALTSTKTDKASATADSQTAATSATQEAPQQDIRLFAAMEAQRNLQTAKEPTLALATAGMPAGPERKSEERSIFSKSSSESTYAGVASSGVTPDSAIQVSADPTLVADPQPAESVKYWISQDMQNAELQLDGLGEKPVEVIISMHGNAAHVAFRSDEAQTRGVLEAAGSHLKDMMQREGVLLSGVSVGTSGSNDGRGGQASPRQGLKVAQVAPALPTAVDAVRRSGTASGRSVDLFV
jgi:flagellar hook-length control protein FliK